MENILAVKASELIQPVSKKLGDYSDFIIKDLPKFKFYDRGSIEWDTSYKQLIPYQILKCGDMYLSYNRDTTESESRLYNNFSIGVGGHINDGDTPDGTNQEDASIINSMRVDCNLEREFIEELGCDFTQYVDIVSVIGVINNNDNEVSEHHIGLVYLEEIKYGLFTNAILKDVEFLSIDELLSNYDRYENWSKIVIDYLKG